MRNFETEAFVRAPGEGKIVDVLGMTHIYKVTGVESGGHVSIWESIVPPGLGAPPHTHTREDEAFYVLSGELEMAHDGGVPVRVGPGGFFFGRRGHQHTFRNPGDIPARVLIVSTGQDLDQMFLGFEAATRGVQGPPPVDQIVGVAAAHGVTVVVPAGA